MTTPALQKIFLLGFGMYAASHKLPDFIRKAVWCIMNCRTAVMGGHVQACPDGHFERNHYNSCKHRICPLCAFIQVQKWLSRQKARILACDHFHVIFTIAHELNCLWHFNKRLITEILFQSARDTIFELLQDKKYLGAKPGVIASMHTWTRTLALHPHIHCLVTGGGLNGQQWINLRYDYLFPFAVASKLFRGKVLHALLQALDKGSLVLPAEISPAQLRKDIAKLRKKKWNVHVREKYTHGNGVLTYLAKYLRGGPISNKRIIKVQDDQVTFLIGRKKKEFLTLSIQEFIGRFIQHIPLPSSVLVRSYGIYSSTQKHNLQLCHHLLGQKSVESSTQTQWQDVLEDCFPQKEDSPWLCPVCGKRMIRRSLIPRSPISPLSARPPCHDTLLTTA